MSPKHHQNKFEKEVLERLARIETKIDIQTAILIECCESEKPPFPLPTGVAISQIIGGKPMSITGVNVGGSGTFQASPVPDTSTFPSGTVDTWTASDPSIQITPADPNDPMDTSVVVAVPSASTLTTFNLTVSVQMPPATPGGSAPAALTATVAVPVIAAPPPLPTGVAINQTA